MLHSDLRQQKLYCINKAKYITEIKVIMKYLAEYFTNKFYKTIKAFV